MKLRALAERDPSLKVHEAAPRRVLDLPRPPPLTGGASLESGARFSEHPLPTVFLGRGP